jgi:tetratricopeptide (TPR) repeat protein
MADAWLDLCDLGKAYDFRRQNVDLSRDLYKKSPGSDFLKLDLAWSLSGLADIQRRIPLPEQALLNLQESYELLMQLAEQDAENPLRSWEALMRENKMIQIRSWTEPPEKLWPEMRTHRQVLDTFFLEANLQDFTVAIDYADTLIDYSRFAWRVGEKEEADRALQDATDRLSGLVGENPENRSSRRLLAGAWYEYWTRHGKLPPGEAVTRLDGYLVDPEQATSCDDASLAARLEFMRGNISRAKGYTLYLLGKGFFEPGFVAFCQRNELCEK